MWHKAVQYILKYPLGCLILIGLCVLISLRFIPGIEISEDTDFYTLENDPAVLFHENFKAEFGDDEFFLVTLHAQDIFTTRNLQVIDELTAALEKLPDVHEVRSLTNVDDIVGTDSVFSVDPLIPELPQTAEALASLKAQTMRNKIFVNSLVSSDLQVAAILVRPELDGSPLGFRGNILSETDRLLDQYRAQGIELRMTGWTLTNYLLNQYSIEDLRLFIPLTTLMVILIVAFFFRSGGLTLIAASNILVNFLVCAAVMSLVGVPLNNVTGIVFPVLLCISLSDCVHIFAHYAEARGADARLKILHVFKEVAHPCFLTSLTTGIGFASLMFSEVPPIFDFGLVASISVFLEFFIGLLIVPPLLLFFKPDISHRQLLPARTFQLVDSFVCSWRRSIFFTCVLFVVVSIGSLSYLRVDTNLIEYFKSSSVLRQDLAVIEQHLAGSSTLDVSLQTAGLDGFKEPAALQIVEQLQASIDALPAVDYSLSLVDLLKEMHSSFNAEDQAFLKLPETRELIEQYLILYDSDDIEDSVNFDFDHTRIAIRTSLHSTIELAELIRKLESLCAESVPTSIVCTVTGQEKKFVVVASALVDGQIQSITYAHLIVLVIMIFTLKSIPFGFFSLVPNMLPILGNFLVMVLLDIPINTGTALISSVAFGIAVDDSIHFLVSYCKARESGKSVQQAVQRTLSVKGAGILTSSLILALGFAILAFGQFVPVIQFGLLTAVVMLTALLADVLFLPAFFYLCDEWKSAFTART